jgi:site-specific DNA-methyltransferase (adenine-specific)
MNPSIAIFANNDPSDKRMGPMERRTIEAESKRKSRLNTSLMFSSKDGTWTTPPDFFAHLNRLFGPFTLDAAASRENACCPKFLDKKIDALSVNWPGVVYLNPPYGREIGLWIEKARWEAHAYAGRATRVVCLVPARTDTKWWHEHIVLANMVLFLRGRLKFGGAATSAPFPSAVAVFERRGRNNIKRKIGTLTREGEISILAG